MSQFLGDTCNWHAFGSTGTASWLNYMHRLKRIPGTCPYCGHFHVHKQFRLLERLRNCFIWSAITDHEDCHFQSQNQSRDAKVMRVRSEGSLTLARITLTLLLLSTIQCWTEKDVYCLGWIGLGVASFGHPLQIVKIVESRLSIEVDMQKS